MSHPVVWFEVLGKNGDALHRFYSELFGWSFKIDNPMKYGIVDTKSDRGIPGGVGPAYDGTRPWVTFYVESADVAATLAEAERLGGTVVMPKKTLQSGDTIAMFEDPEGHAIGVVQARPA